MVNPGKRMNILQALLALRHGPGAAILPPEITRIHMDFATKWNDGHLGPRKFWRSCLPRLKFWNPAIPMLVNRSENQAGPATMSIYFRQNSSSSDPISTTELVRNMLPLAQQPHSSIENEHPAPPPEEGERVVTIDMKNVHSDVILSEFLEKTNATVIHPTPDELVEMKQVEERKERGAIDRAIVKKYIDDKRSEERMLSLAKQEAEAIKAANQ
ncbi:mitochondrial ribosomal protein L51 [Xylaria bambusicola]|uniref:mitochondrial ribosomal protein L51 n=1 Tax=Xylaria bambusicola TaxID=326684 RepID=UPI002008D88A|nr:mitochondrial ribosomal protein L51 [Xylaria bambusicola]KAI0512844.1 mitochondrial ribosomal protein L51 [Xylaria bambusicola]